MDGKTCKHTICSCPVEEGKDYCSVACEKASPEHNHGDGCGCGHDGCTGRKDASKVLANT